MRKINRRDFLAGAGAILGANAIPSPVRSLLSSRDTEVPFIPSASDYIQDGLVAMYDGIENAGTGIHNPYATIWKDLGPNNIDMDIFSVAHFERNCLRTPDSRPNGKIYGDTGVSIKWVACEFVAECIGAGGVLSFSGMADDRFFGLYPDYVQFADPYTMTYSDGSIPAKGTFSCSWYGYSNVLAFANKEELVVGSTTNHWSRNDLRTTFGLGGSGNPNAYAAWQFTGRIFCIRLYDHILTGDEVAYNYALDQERFGL